MKINYLKFIVLILGLISVNLVNGKLISKKESFGELSYLKSEALKNTSNLSDKQLYEIAKNINDDALPGESDYAQIILTEALRKNPKNVNALLESARTLETQNIIGIEKLQKQFSFVYQAFLIEPTNPKVRYKFSELLLALEQKELFQKIYSQTLQDYPDSIETKIEKIQILSKTDPQTAIKIANSVLKNGGDVLQFLPDFLIALQKINPENFSKNLLSYSEKYPNRWLWYHLGLQYIKENKFEDAEKAFKKSIDLGNIITARLQLGIVQYQNKNKINESVENFKTVIQTLHKNPFISENIVYFAHIQLARALMISKNSEETLKELKFVSRYSFQNHEYFTYLINEYLKYGHEEILAEPMKVAIEHDPLFAPPYIILSNIFKKQKNLKLAHEFYEKFTILSMHNNSHKQSK